MKIKILRSTISDGKIAMAGTVIDATETSAKILISIGKAEIFTETETETESIPENRMIPETEIKRRGRKRREI